MFPEETHPTESPLPHFCTKKHSIVSLVSDLLEMAPPSSHWLDRCSLVFKPAKKVKCSGNQKSQKACIWERKRTQASDSKSQDTHGWSFVSVTIHQITVDSSCLYLLCFYISHSSLCPLTSHGCHCFPDPSLGRHWLLGVSVDWHTPQPAALLPASQSCQAASQPAD